MVLANIEYQGFRNLSDRIISFDDNFSVIIGNNAAGKTNFLEAIFYVAFASSFRTNEEKSLIRFNENHLRVTARSSERTGSVFYNGEKRLTLEGNAKQRLSDYVGWLLVTVFSLEDIWLVRSVPARRRAFLDWLIAKLNPSYLVNLGEYRKIVRQRNSALQMVRENHDESLLEVYDEQLVLLGNKLYKERQKIIPELNNHVKDLGAELGLKNLSIAYHSTCPDMVLTSSILKKNRLHEIKWGETTTGPHRDDIVFCINDHSLKEYASEGEERSAVIALKLAEAELLRTTTCKHLILLLDEIAAELDSGKKKILLNLITRLNVSDQNQVFYASTQVPDFIDSGHFRKFTVKDGAVEVS